MITKYRVNSQGSYQTVIQIGKNDAWLGLEVLRLAAGESWEGESGAAEAGLVPLSGKFAVSINGAQCAQWSGVGGRPDMFSATPWAVYVPRQSSFKVTAETKLGLVIAKAPCEKDLPPAIVKPEDVRVVNAGAANWRRDVRLVIPPGSPLSQRMIIGETVPVSYAKNTLTLPFNDIKSFKSLLTKQWKSIACVIVEPVVGNIVCVLPRTGFLETLRSETEKHGIVLIFDEVMTGFRVSHGGA